MNSSKNLMTLPPEIREIILTYLFDTPRLVHIRCPSHCRLRQSRIDKDDPSGILYVCRLLRQEAIPPFFAVNTLRFRHSSEILDYLTDPRLDPRISYNLTRIAVDDGDVMDLEALKLAQATAILTTFTMAPRLRALEFRAWARTDNEHYLTNLNELYEFWEFIKTARYGDSTGNAPDAVAFHDLVTDGQHRTLVMDIVRSAGFHVIVQDSKEKYSSAALSRLTQPDGVYLHVCNLLLSKKRNEERKLECAKNAVSQRMKVAGATHIKDENVLERITWGDSTLLDAGRVVLGERYH